MDLTWRAQLVFMNGENIRHATTIRITKDVTSYQAAFRVTQWALDSNIKLCAAENQYM
jgi:hypothetical protein